MTSNYDALREYIFGLDIIDTHEHTPSREALRPQQDVLAEYLQHYFSCDLVSAGLPRKGLEFLRDSSQPLMERWKVAEPFWDAARNTGYGRSLDISVKALYGLDRIDRKTIGPLNEAFQAARSKGGVYQRVLKDLCKISVSICDSDLECDRRFFRSAFRLDDFVMVSNTVELAALGERAGIAIHTLEDLEQACEAVLEQALAKGAICLKSGLAYHRSLLYEKVTHADAQAEFCRLFSDANVAPAWGRPRGHTAKLQDYMMHCVLRLADRRGLTFQFHTGLQEGVGNYIRHAEPSQLSNLFLEYGNVRFDLFHIGYPYQQTLSALAKNFPNVFIDFAWAHIISPTAAVNALVEYLDAVPANKISAFGGDYCFVDGVYGHQYLAREDVARALAVKIEQGATDLDRAKEVAKMLLFDNPAEIFHLREALKAGKPRKAGR